MVHIFALPQENRKKAPPFHNNKHLTRKREFKMKASHLFPALLIASACVFTGCTTNAVTAQKEPAKTEKPAAKKKAAPKKSAAKKSAAKKKTTLEQDIKTATTPIVQPRFAKRHALKKQYAAAHKDKIKILMLGDSITHQWEYPAAAEAQKKYITPYNVLNMGFGGDRTQHTLWTIEKSGTLELINPKLVTIMIGTNNRGRNDYRATVIGIKKILDGVQKRYPKAKILLYAIFPRGQKPDNAKRKENEKVNAEIQKFCDGKKIIWIDINKKFLTEKGILEKEIMPDLLHPRHYKGYSIWGESLKPYFETYGK